MTSEGPNVTKSTYKPLTQLLLFCFAYVLYMDWSPWRHPYYLSTCSNIRGLPYEVEIRIEKSYEELAHTFITHSVYSKIVSLVNNKEIQTHYRANMLFCM